MSEIINDEIYERILDDERFLNDIFTTLDSTTKVEVLQKSGFNMLEEYAKVHGEATDNQEEI